MEFAVYGVPIVAHLSGSALQGAKKAGVDEIDNIPIVNTQLGYEGIRHTFTQLLEMPAEDRLAMAKRTRQLIEEF